MMPLEIVGKVDIPKALTRSLGRKFADWPRDRRDVWLIEQPKPWGLRGGTEYLEDVYIEFLERTLRRFGQEWASNEHCIVMFEDVEKHRDEAFQVNGKAGAFLHIVLDGSGVLTMPGVKEPRLRTLQLEKGLVFLMKPTVNHMVTKAVSPGIATLCATVMQQ